MDRQTTDQLILLSAAAANTASSAALFPGFRNVEFEVDQANFTGTVKFVGSNADNIPAFGSAASATNAYDYIKCINLIDGSAVNGATGVSGTATTSTTNLEANTNGFKWFGAIVSSYSGGSVTVKAKGYSNN